MKPRIRWWKIREEEFSIKFRQEISQRVNLEHTNWDDVANAINESRKSAGKKLEDKEIW